MIGPAYEDTLEENGWQQAVSLHRGDVLLDAHRCDEVDVAEGTAADPHILQRENGEGALCLAHAASLQSCLLQQGRVRFDTRGEDQAVAAGIELQEDFPVPGAGEMTGITRRSVNGTSPSGFCDATSGMRSPRTLSRIAPVPSRQSSLCA